MFISEHYLEHYTLFTTLENGKYYYCSVLLIGIICIEQGS